MTRVDPSPEIAMLWLRVCGLSINTPSHNRKRDRDTDSENDSTGRQINREREREKCKDIKATQGAALKFF